MKKHWILVCAFFSVNSVFADSLSLGIPDYRGTGCPNGSAATVLSPDATQLSILFDAFTVEANASQRRDRKACELMIPVHVPSGYSISIFEMDYRGFSSIPEGASADLDVDAFFTGIKANGPRHRNGLRAKARGNFFLSHRIANQEMVWSPCGKDVTLRVISQLSVATNPAGDQTLAAVDTIDVSSGLIYQIQTRSCAPPQPPHPPNPPPRPPMPPIQPHPRPGPHNPPQPPPKPCLGGKKMCLPS